MEESRITSVVAVTWPQGAKTESGCTRKHCPEAWDIVWCHDHCRKEKMGQTWKQYAKTCKDVLASMIPKKKAKRYLAWQKEQQHSRPHLLMTCWREVKPILRELAKTQGNSCYPLAILVLAKSDDETLCASDWARSLTDFNITVLRGSDFERLTALLVCYSAKVLRVPLPEELSATYNMVQALPENTRAQEAVKNEPCAAPRTQGKTSTLSAILSPSPGTALSMCPFTGMPSETVKNEPYIAASCAISVPAQMLSSSPGMASSTNKIRDAWFFHNRGMSWSSSQ